MSNTARNAGYVSCAAKDLESVAQTCYIPGRNANFCLPTLDFTGRSHLRHGRSNLQHRRGFLRVQYCDLRKSCSKRPGELSCRLAISLSGIFTTFLLFSNFSVVICTARRSDLQQRRDPDCQILQLQRQFCPPGNCPFTCYIPASHFELIVGCKFPTTKGGAIRNKGTLTVKYGNFTSNSASSVCILAPHRQRSQLAIFLPGISQLFFSFLTFLLLFAQYGGAIVNDGTLTVNYGNFTGNSANKVCVIAPLSQRSQLAIFLPDIEQF